MSLSDSSADPTQEFIPVPANPPTANLSENTMSDSEFDPDDIELCTHAETTRVERWKNRLLDLSLRNTLLNFEARAASGSLHFTLKNAGAFEDALVGNENVFEIFAEDEIPAESTEQSLLAEKKLIAIAPIRRSGNATAAERVQDRLTKIARASKTAIAETGANTLFVALGFLCWKCEKRRGEILRAPLVLVPAKLVRARGAERFSLSASDEDVRLNLTLAEMLRQEFGITLSGLEDALPEDESGIDMAEVFRIFREAVGAREGFSVEESCALGNFSFAKYLMWRDLEERRDKLARSRIVRHLLDETRTPFETEQAFPRPEQLDTNVPAGKLFCPLPADSSQLAAVCAAASGKNFILVGPPGTGKSQTIANLIAHTLAIGKTVLFVAEKSAALNVVFRRLKKIGLGDFCLELHSDKTNKREAYAQFAMSLELAGSGGDGDAERKQKSAAASVQNLRNTFLTQSRILHEKRGNGLSLAEAVGVICSNETAPEIELLWERPLADTVNIRERKQKAATDLSAAFDDTHGSLDRPAGTLKSPTWSQGWQRKAESAVKHVEDKAGALGLATAEFTVATGLLPEGGTITALKKLLELVKALLAVRGEPLDLVLGADAEKNLATLHAAAVLADNCARHKALLSLPYAEEAANDPELDSLLKTWREAEVSWILPRWLKRRKVIRALRVLADGSPEMPLDPRVDLGNLIAIRSCKKEFSENYSAIAATFPSLIKDLNSAGVLPRIAALEKAHKLCVNALEELESVPEKRDAWRAVFERWLSGKDTAFAPKGIISAALNAVESALAKLYDACEKLEAETGAVLPPEALSTPESAEEFAAGMLADKELWRDICTWNMATLAAERRGMRALADAVRSRAIPAEDAGKIFDVNYCRRWAEVVYDSEPELLNYTSGKNVARIRAYRTADTQLRNASAKAVRARLIERSRAVFEKNAATELSLLRHEIGKRQAHLPIRRFLSRAPKMLRLLKPCMLTSPLSAAQYLDAAAEPFDLVVFDEASQISVWDAVGALARGKSAVVVGDPKQLPPTSFFRSAVAPVEDVSEKNDAVAVPADAESVLEECRACGVPAMNLAWHYRSRAESLIAFSNARYYDGGLMTFPAPKACDRALEYVFCENGIYGNGSARTNPAEAKAVVERIVAELTQPDFVYDESSSIGVVTFNATQQDLICRLLEEAQEARPEIRRYFSEEEVREPVFVKNLENVQGDERGVIYFSTTFGPDEQGFVSQNFGPINRDGGERRLNVAITRSRTGMKLFTSLKPGDIRTTSGGMADLREFLEFARTGTLVAKSGKSATTATDTQCKDAPEDTIVAGLEAKGWKCVRDVGFSGIRVDIAVIHPEKEEEYLAGILCDGNGSLFSPTVRDRELLREEVLRGLGWNLLRAWMLDRWQAPDLAISRLDARLRHFLEEQKSKEVPLPSESEPVVPEEPSDPTESPTSENA